MSARLATGRAGAPRAIVGGGQGDGGAPAGTALSRPRRRLRRLGGALALLGTAVVLGGCNAPTYFAFRGATTQGHDEFKLWVLMVSLGLAVAVFVWALIFWSIVVYRRRNDVIPRQFHEHIPLEITYTVIPFIMVLGIFWATVLTENNVDAIASHPAVTVNVTAFQWGWQFNYQGEHVTIVTSEAEALAILPADPTNPAYPQMYLPLGETVQINLRSNDVAHSLWVPAFNFSRMALPGYVNQFDFTPTTIGVYGGRCNQYCGLYHSEMLFNVHVVSDSAFQSWLTAHRSPPGGGV
jgi:cytochrome c oxidase subunit II